MLKHQLIHPRISEILARAGHHSVILIADGNYPVWGKKGPNAELVSLNLSGKITSKADILERGDDRGGVRVTEADRLAITVSEVDVADVAAAGAERGGVRDLLDVHMEQVAE